MKTDDNLVERIFDAVEMGSNGGHAIAVIAHCFRDTNNAEARRFLAGIVVDNDRPSDLRLGAYCALMEVCGRELTSLPLLTEFKIPDHFDMLLLQQCLKAK